MTRQEDLKKLIRTHTRRLQKLKEQQALFGLHTPPHIALEIEDTEAEIEQLKDELDALRTQVAGAESPPAHAVETPSPAPSPKKDTFPRPAAEDIAPPPALTDIFETAQGARQAWSTEAGEQQRPSSSPIEAGGLLWLPIAAAVSAPQQAALHRLSLANGQRRGSQNFQDALISGLQPVRFGISDIAVLVALYSAGSMQPDGALLALDAAGQEVWRWKPGVQAVSAPTLAGDLVWMTTNTGALVAVDLIRGTEQTRIALDKTPSLAAPTLGDGGAYIPCRGPYLLAVGLAGQSRWQFQADVAGAWLDQSPLVVDDLICAVLNLGGAVVALRSGDGQPAWQVTLGPPGKPLSPPTTDGERLYVGTRTGLHALNLTDGHLIWHVPLERGIEAAPVVVGDVVYAAGRDHHLYAVYAATGQELWRYAAERRLEVPPLITADPHPLAIIADRGGTLTALKRPLSLAEHEAAEQWLDAAAAAAVLGQHTRAAELLQNHDEPLKAAHVWHSAGQLEPAATQYEAAGAWRQAAELWQQLDRPQQRAEALEKHARTLSDQAIDDETRARAWELAAQAFAGIDLADQAAACQIEVARYRHLPNLAVEVEHGALLLNAWARLRFIVHNQGHGPAQNLIIRARGGQFEGQVAETRQIIVIRAGQTREDWLDVRPLAHGDSVPLRVSIDYEDRTRAGHTWQKTLYLPVAETKVEQEKTSIPGIPAHLSNALREVLASCEQFDTNRSVRNVFTHEWLRPWRNSLPQADTLMGRIDAAISFLHDKRRRDGANALVLLLRVLKTQIASEDERHGQLATLADELEHSFGGGTPSVQHPDTTTVTVQVMIHLEIDIEDFTSFERENLILALSQIASIGTNQLRILKVMPGSVLVTIEMPEEAAQLLVSMYLAGDPALHKLRIAKVELEQITAERLTTGELAESQPHPQTTQPGAPATESRKPGHRIAPVQPVTKRSQKPSRAKQIDFFISYNRHDRQWAEWIAWQLEEAGYTTVVQAWDFRPGGNFVTAMQRATAEAERTIAVLSPDYLTSRFTQPEWNAAFAEDPTGEKGLLLPVRVRDCELKGLLPQIVYIDLVGMDEKAAQRELVAGVKRGRAKPAAPPAFPAAIQHAKPEQPPFPGDSPTESPD